MKANKDLSRYQRQIRLPNFGTQAQQNILKSRVLVVGAGGLGCPSLLYLAAAGTGAITIIDDDIISPSNLHRQILFTEADCGKPKAEVAAQKLRLTNPDIQVNALVDRFTVNNAEKLLREHDVVLDGTDNFNTRYLVNDACVLFGKPNVFASVFRYEGQLSVFNYTKNGTAGPNYRDLFPEIPPPELIPDCATAGVLGALTGMLGSIQAMEALKICGNFGEPLSGKMLLIDAFTMEMNTIHISKNPDNPITSKSPRITHLDAANYQAPISCSTYEISPDELRDKINKKENVQIIDVREHSEFEVRNIGGLHQALSQIRELDLDKSNNSLYVVVCEVGQRSATAQVILQEKYPKKTFLNLKGGVVEYFRE